jgi:hypothetical protein
MKPGMPFGFSEEQKLDVWRCWKAGQSLHEIGRAFGKEHSFICCRVSRHGGIAPAVPRRALSRTGFRFVDPQDLEYRLVLRGPQCRGLRDPFASDWLQIAIGAPDGPRPSFHRDSEFHWILNPGDLADCDFASKPWHRRLANARICAEPLLKLPEHAGIIFVFKCNAQPAQMCCK